jgi:hypothetical protein
MIGLEENRQVSTAYLINQAIRSVKTLKADSNSEVIQLIEEIKKTLNELENIRNYFDAVSEPDLVDYAIYREKAEMVRLSHLLKIARDNKEILKEIKAI